MRKIFISYSHKDREITEKLDHLLELTYGDGNVWYDTNIRGAKGWWEQIVDELNNCHIVVYLLSEASHISEYCQKELDEALKHDKPIVVMQIDRNFPIPPKWEYHQCDKLYDDEYEISLEGVCRLHGAILDALNLLTTLNLSEKHRQADIKLLTLLWSYINTNDINYLSDEVQQRKY